MTPLRQAALLSVGWITIMSWAPAALLILLPNNWYWLIAKLVVGFALLGVVLNLLPPRSLGVMGDAGWGFIINLIAFSSLLCFPMPRWAKFILLLLIASIWHVCAVIIEKHNSPE